MSGIYTPPNLNSLFRDNNWVDSEPAHIAASQGYIPIHLPMDNPVLGDLTNVTPGASPRWGQAFGQKLRDIGLIGGTDDRGNKTDSWGGLALSGVSSLLNGFMAMKQYGIAKDSLAASKEEFAKNYAAQQKQVNASLEDRQRARVASNPGAYQSVSDYMKTHGI